MAAAPQFRIDVDARNLLLHSLERARPAASAALSKRIILPEPIFPQCPEKLTDPGPVPSPEKRSWSFPLAYPARRGSSFPNIQSRAFPVPGDFHPASAFSFVEYKCNLNW
jgi:hypothetical protein